VPQVPWLRLAGAAGVLLATTVDGTAGTVRTQALDLATAGSCGANPAEEFLHSPLGGADGLLVAGTGADRTSGGRTCAPTGRSGRARCAPAPR